MNYALAGFFNPSLSRTSFVIPFFSISKSNDVFVQSLADDFTVRSFTPYDPSPFETFPSGLDEMTLRVGDNGLFAVILDGELFHGGLTEVRTHLAQNMRASVRHPFFDMEAFRFIGDKSRHRIAIAIASKKIRNAEHRAAWRRREYSFVPKAFAPKALPNRSVAQQQSLPFMEPVRVENAELNKILSKSHEEIRHWLAENTHNYLWGAVWLQVFEAFPGDQLELMELAARWIPRQSTAGLSRDVTWAAIWRRLTQKFPQHPHLTQLAISIVEASQPIEHKYFILVHCLRYLMAISGLDALAKIRRPILNDLLKEVDLQELSIVDQKDWSLLFKLFARHHLFADESYHARATDVVVKNLEAFPRAWVDSWTKLISLRPADERLVMAGKVRLTHPFPPSKFVKVWRTLFRLKRDDSELIDIGLNWLKKGTPNLNTWPGVWSDLFDVVATKEKRNLLELGKGWLVNSSSSIEQWPRFWTHLVEKLPDDRVLVSIARNRLGHGALRGRAKELVQKKLLSPRD